MRRIALLLLLLGTLAHAQDNIKIPKEIRVKNPDLLCWWCSAATAGKLHGITPLEGLPELVKAKGIGKKGATQDSIDYWMKELGVKPLINREGDKSEEAIKRVQGWLDRGLPAVVSYKHDSGYHAILLTRISREKETWKTDSGEEAHDYSVTYYDPDAPEKVWKDSWNWFISAWTGKAYAFDPGMQDPAIVRPRDLRPGRLMLNGKFVSPEIQERVKLLTRPVEVRQQAPPYAPHEVPYNAAYPSDPYAKAKIPSNQDIRDGVTRPADVIYRDNASYYGHDYYSEYRAFKARKERESKK